VTAQTAPSGSTQTGHGVLMRRVALGAVITASCLVVLKAVAFILTDSMAMMASLADSALDVFASFVNLLAIRHALQPADREHRFGHGKAEPLAGLAQSAFIGGSAAFLVIESVQRLIVPRAVTHGTVGLAVMAVSIVATVLLVVAQKYVIRRTGSIAIRADSAHYVSDVLVNAGVILGIVLATDFGLLPADPIVGIAIAAIIAWTAWGVFRQSYDQLMDRELPESDRETIKTIVMRQAGVGDMHDLRTRAAGTRSFIQLHIELDPALSLYQAHAIGDAVEAAIQIAFPQAEIIIHHDPQGYEQPEPLAKS
jgi:ferrous-iron efflux pump FieF